MLPKFEFSCRAARRRVRLTVFYLFIFAWFAEAFTCPGQFGSYPDEYACENYWTCVFSKPEAQKCLHGLMTPLIFLTTQYDDSLQNCAWPNPYTCKMQHGKAIRKSAKSTTASKTDAENPDANNRKHRHRAQSYNPSPPQPESLPPPEEQAPPTNAEWSWTHGQTLPPRPLTTTTNAPPYQPLQSDGLEPIAWVPPRNRRRNNNVPSPEQQHDQRPPAAEQPQQGEQQLTTARFALPVEQQQQAVQLTAYNQRAPADDRQPQYTQVQIEPERPSSDGALPPPPPPPYLSRDDRTQPPLSVTIELPDQQQQLATPRKIAPQRRQLFDPQQLSAARYAVEQQLRLQKEELQQQQDAVPSSPTTSTERYSHPAVTVVPVGVPPPSCDPRQCLLPDCYCDAAKTPGGFDKKDTPQFVLVTFDDGVSELNYQLYQSVFKRKNPNGCPIRGTLFLSHEWSDYGMVQNLYSMGHEIASHTISHGNGGSFSKTKWYDEIVGLREIAAKFALVNESDVIGFRAPFLETGTDVMYQVLYENGFVYDSSIPSNSRDPPMWPYTMEYKFPHVCWISPCPLGSYPGLWEVPMTHLMDDANHPCAMYDACTWPATSDGVTEQLFKNFLQHYRTNRAPFPLFAHSNWQQSDETHRQGFSVFLDTILEAPDVWLVTIAQLLEWIKHPVPLSQMHEFLPTQCTADGVPANRVTRVPRCTTPQSCKANFKERGGEERYMSTCQPCPKYYPWIKNTSGE